MALKGVRGSFLADSRYVLVSDAATRYQEKLFKERLQVHLEAVLFSLFPRTPEFIIILRRLTRWAMPRERRPCC